MPRKKAKRKRPVLRGGICESCGGGAKGGAWQRRGVDLVRICPRCLPTKSEVEKYIDQDQAEQLLAAAEEIDESGRTYELLFLGLNLGTRVGELVRLKATDFDVSRQRVLVRTLKRKGHPALPVYLSPDMVKALRTILHQRKGFLFPRFRPGRGKKTAGGHISESYARKLFKKASLAAGLDPKISAHSMRHFAAINILETTGDLYFCSRQLRHASIKTTEQYLHLLPALAREKAKLVPAVGISKGRTSHAR